MVDIRVATWGKLTQLGDGVGTNGHVSLQLEGEQGEGTDWDTEDRVGP